MRSSRWSWIEARLKQGHGGEEQQRGEDDGDLVSRVAVPGAGFNGRLIHLRSSLISPSEFRLRCRGTMSCLDALFAKEMLLIFREEPA